MATKKKTETKPKTTEAKVTKEKAVVVDATPTTLFEFIKQQKEKQK
jgi:hypothetical protein